MRSSRRVDAGLVEAVPELVDGGHQAVHVALVVARGETDVGRRRAHRERVDGRIEPPRLAVVAELLEHLQGEGALLVDREMAREARVVDRVRPLGDLGDQRDQLGLQLVEDRSHLGRLHALVEVVEQHVVVVLRLREARDVFALKLHVAPQIGQEDREVGLLPGFDPGSQRNRTGACQLGAQIRRDPRGLGVLAPGDAEQAGLVRVVVVALLIRAQLLEERADVVVDEELVGDPVERAELLGADVPCFRRHLGVLIPREDRTRHVHVVNLGQLLPELFVAVFHVPSWSALAGRLRPAQHFLCVDAARVPEQEAACLGAASGLDLGAHLIDGARAA